jgi:soluble P-type ATPase
MNKTMKRVSALLLAVLMVIAYMPLAQENSFAKKKKAKKPAKVKIAKASVKKNTKKITVSWKKAKNAKKYIVSIKDLSTKLTSSKTSKKVKITFNGQWNTKYQIRVRGVNGKKKGAWSAKKTVKVGVDPKYTKALKDADENKKAAEEAQKAAEEAQKANDQAAKDLNNAQKKLENLERELAASDVQDILRSIQLDQAKAALNAAKDELANAQAVVDAYNALTNEQKAALPADVKSAIETLAGSIDDTKARIAQLEENIEKIEEEIEKLEKVKELHNAKSLKHEDWNPEVAEALNDMIVANSNSGKYVVFDFDNTCSIFDVEEQLAVFQLQVMAFEVTPAELPDVLATELNPEYFTSPAPASGDYCSNANATYQDWIDDITAAYTKLYNKYGPFDAGGLAFDPDDEDLEELHADEDWKEFATKMRAMYDCVFDSESASVAYPWVLYWFTGMTHDEVYDLAYRSHSYYSEVESEEITWTSPSGYTSAIGVAEYTWTAGTQVSDNIIELMAALDNNGIDVWVCSASATDPIRAAIDVWGLHDHITGLLAMTNKYDDVFDNEYDYTNGCAWMPTADDDWEEGVVPTKAQTQGKGKVTAIENVCMPLYNGAGPIAGFMDSTGDYNFCTEFADLEVVCCFNRASRKVTDGGGVIAELAVYQADNLNYDYYDARTAGDTLYVLQGRDERGLRKLNPKRTTWRLGKSSELLFRGSDNYTQLDKMIELGMDTKTIVDDFAIKTPAGDPKYGFDFKYGFLTEYDGYHSIGEEAPHNPNLLKHADWNPEVKTALNGMMNNPNNEGEYVVFDFDNTCSIFDVEEQLAVYQLEKMAFAFTPDELPGILATELNPEYFEEPAPASADYCDNPNATYGDWIADIKAAYTTLYDQFGPFTAEGLSEADQATVQATDAWKEFATKMRAMYDCVFDSESASVAYPWVLYWFTGMSHDEVYNLAYESHSKYKELESSEVTWETGAYDSTSKIGHTEYTWTSGTQVSENIVELMKCLDANGIDVWVCSASATDPIRAAIDVWGLHDYVTGMMAMTNVYQGHKFVNEYDYKNGAAWMPIDGGEWEEGITPTKAQTQGKGKVTAIQNVCYPIYGHGPIAGFMDSTGDYNFCTEFKTLQVVTCFNRASRKVTDGGGVIAELAVYQADELDLTYARALGNEETLYVLQGRDERGLRKLNPHRTTWRLGKSSELLFRGDENYAQLDKMIELGMDTETIVNDFAIKTAAGDPKYGFSFKYGFLEQYDGYHSQR